MPDIDKHSSLLQKFVNYGRKKFYNIGPAVQGEGDPRLGPVRKPEEVEPLFRLQPQPDDPSGSQDFHGKGKCSKS